MAELKAWETMTPEEKMRKLYEKQKVILDTFLEHGAISRQQYEKSLGNLTEKMGYGKTNFNLYGNKLK